MSFAFNWNFFNQDELCEKAKEVMAETMNQGEIPPAIVDKLSVESLDFGTIPPRLEILEIGDLGIDRFRGIFRLEYEGDASLTLRTTVEANPLAQALDIMPGTTSGPSGLARPFGFPQMLSPTRKSLKLPLRIHLEQIRLSAIIILVYSEARGLTLVFRNDPVQSVKVSSTFDFVPSVADFLRQEIEERLRESFREDIPEVLYQLTQPKDDRVDETVPFFYHPAHPTALVASPDPEDPSLTAFAYSDISGATQRMAPLSDNAYTLSLGVEPFRDTISRATLDAYERDHHISQKRAQSHRPEAVHPKRRVVKLSDLKKKMEMETKKEESPASTANSPYGSTNSSLSSSVSLVDSSQSDSRSDSVGYSHTSAPLGRLRDASYSLSSPGIEPTKEIKDEFKARMAQAHKDRPPGRLGNARPQRISLARLPGDLPPYQSSY
uniref:Mitochondrial distribution and morphology protein 34 n=1 Tax=Blastobotrys adeninivorans TaxID=409370 RepID=A0A060SYR5_BLAAD